MRELVKRGFSGNLGKEETEMELKHREVALNAASESFVLLKNDGVMPVSKDKKIALFGRGADKTIKGGTGSGDVNERRSISIYEGLSAYGYEITTIDWIEQYTEVFDKERMLWRNDILERVGANEGDFFDVYATTPFVVPKCPAVMATDTDTALYVVSRVAGEGADRRLEKGDYYFTDDEESTLKDICSLYKNVILVINTGAVIDLSILDKDFANNIKGVILYGQPGMEGGHALAKVLSGEVNPSGKLTDTWPINYEDLPSAMEFSHLNGDITKEVYSDGIFVGYRYFDSFNKPVRYSFGYGLSYTNFEMSLISEKLSKENATLDLQIKVKNTGKCAGKEVVQVYISLPYEKKEDALDKEFRRLAGFKKTSLLNPLEEEVLNISISLNNLTSFDEEAASYVLEKGMYGVFIGNGLNNLELVLGINNAADQVFSVVEHICPVLDDISELIMPEDLAMEHYNDVIGKIKGNNLPVISVEEGFVETKHVTYTDDLYAAASMENDPILHDAEAAVEKLTLDELILLAMGDPLRQHDGQLGAAGSSVPGSAGETNHIAKEKGIAGIALADGPAGLRLASEYKVHEGKVQYLPFYAALENGYFYDEVDQPGDSYFQYCTAIPVGVSVAQTWNEDIVKELGKIVGEEMLWLGITLWLAPGMNIHRNPLCGRNFEYYAEDPVLSGKIAAAMTLGVQVNPGVGTTIKHFAGNNLEDNRVKNNSVIREKTLREMYLRGFEIAVKESQPMAVMTSYNKINRVHSANNHDLCMKVLRNEWGFKGLVMTDWLTTRQQPYSTAAGCMRAGNDLVMPGELIDVESIKSGLADGSLDVTDLKKCITRLICTIFKSNQYENAKPYAETLN